MIRAFLLVVCAAAAAGGVHSATVWDLIKANDNLSTLASLLQQAGLDSTLSSGGPFTVYAPTNTAFSKVPSYKLKYLKANKDKLAAILNYHVAQGNYSTANLYVHEKIPTAQGSALYAEYVTGTLELGLDSATCDKDVKFIDVEISAANGRVQEVNTVMTPPAVIFPDEVFWVEQRGAGRAGFSGYDCRAKGYTTLTQGEEKPVGVAVDSEAQLMFWSNDQDYKPYDSWLTSVYFNGTNLSKFVTNMYDPQGLDTDTVNKKLYIAQHKGNTISRVSYDGSSIETVKKFDSDSQPADVAVDPNAKMVFVTVQSASNPLNGSLWSMNYDGTNATKLYGGLQKNYGLCVDTYAQQVFYIQGGHGGTISCHAYGSTACANGQNKPIVGNLEYPYMCAVDNVYAPYGGPTRLIFSEPNVPGSVYVVDTSGSNLQLIASDLDAPMGVALGTFQYYG